MSNHLLAAADEKSRKYEWMAAADLYRQALGQMEQTRGLSEQARVADLLAGSHYKAAFQSPDREEFVRRAELAREFYARAAGTYEKVGAEALSKKSKSRGLFATFWLEEGSEKRRDIVQQCVSLSNEAAQSFESQGESTQLAKTHKEILSYSREIMHLAKDWQLRKQELREILDAGRKAITQFSNPSDDEGLIEALHPVLWALANEAEIILEPSEFKQLSQETATLGQKMLDACLKIGTPHARCLADEAAGDIAWDLEGDLSKALTLYKAAATSAREINDQFAIGRLLAVHATLQHWIAMTAEYGEERRQAAEEGLRLTEEAVEHLKIPFHTSYLARAHSICAGCHIVSAEFVETDAAKKRAQLERAIDVARRGMAYEDHTVEWYGCAHELSKATYFLGIATLDLKEKESLLHDALPIREETIRVTDILQPHSWNRGVMRNYLALIKAELASTQQDPEARSRLLQEAGSHMEECLDLCGKWAATVLGSAPRLARYCEWYGDILVRLFQATQETTAAESATKAYFNAVEHLNRAGQVGPVPAIRWKIAKVYDSLGDFKEASTAFGKAAEGYKLAGPKIPGLASTFDELATYMEAWAEIEDSRFSHVEEEYAVASEKYAKAAKTLQATKTWNYLSSICAARSLLEKGEELSRAEKHSESIESITSALGTFRDTTKELKDRLGKVGGAIEEKELKDWLKVARQGEPYCHGRRELEEARVLEKKGEKAASSSKYGSAAETFKLLAVETDSIEDRGEYQTLAQFCEAWARMKTAELKAVPELFADAAESFMKAKESTTRDRFRFLALANASICRALEAGTRFRLTRDTGLYSELKKQLETAADYYQEAGFEKTGSWTRATQRLFDALVYLTEAETEKDPKKKTEFYHLAEKHFELAAKLYGEAGFPRKKEEALRDLGRAREEKQLLLTTMQTIAEIPSASGASITSLTLKGGPAVGLERFEEAKLVGEAKASLSELIIGSDFTVGLDMVNAGKTPATLIKLENIIPEGCEPVTQEGQHQLEGNSIDLRGKRLEYLKTHEVKVSLRATRKGTFELNPRVVFVDEKGNYRSTTFQPSVLTVREPGIAEAVHAPPMVHIPQEFRFENERSRDAFQHLVKEFLDDYMSKRIFVDKAGWRSLMDVVRDMKIPRSSLYGPGGRTGPVLAELERRGLVEVRIFPKERGRGGEIKKVRVAYENSIVKRIVEKAVMQNA